MNAVTEAAGNSLTISRTAANDRWQRALALFVGRGKRFPVADMVKGTGLPSTTIYGWLAGPDSADWRHLHLDIVLSVMGFLGPEFSTELTKLADQGAFWLPDSDETPPGALAADLSEDTATVVRAAADNVFDSAERKALRPVGVRMMARGAQLASMGAAA